MAKLQTNTICERPVFQGAGVDSASATRRLRPSHQALGPGMRLARHNQRHQHGHGLVRLGHGLGQQRRVADVPMHHAVAQRTRSDPGFAGLGQQTKACYAVEIVQNAADTFTEAGQQGR